MLDMKMIRENPENIRKMLKDRDVQFDLDLLLELDKKRREMIISTDNLRKKKNEMSVKISETKKLNYKTGKTKKTWLGKTHSKVTREKLRKINLRVHLLFYAFPFYLLMVHKFP